MINYFVSLILVGVGLGAMVALIMAVGYSILEQLFRRGD